MTLVGHDLSGPPSGNRTRSPHRITANLPPFVALCVVAIVAAVPAYAFYPAIMNADSLALYAGAVIPGPVMDWHSPFLTYLWRWLIHAGAGVPVFTALQSAIYFFSFYWLLTLVRLSVPARLAIVILVLLVPPTMPWIATVEKTTFMSAVLCTCFVCSLRLDMGARHRGLLLSSILAMTLIGTWCRPNAIIIFLPIVAYTAWQARRSGSSKLVGASLVAAFLLLGLGLPALAVHLGAVVRTYPQQATMDLDLLNLSIRTGQPLVPPGILAAPFESLKAAMAPDPFLLGPLDTSLTRITDGHDMKRLQSAWLSAILHHPLTYLHYRFDLYKEYQCLDFSTICLGAWHWYTGGIDANPFGLASRKLGFVFDFYKALAGSVLFHPFFYLLATLAVLIGAITIRHSVVALYAAVLLVFDLSNALLIPGVTVRMVVPLGLMLPFLIAGLYVDVARPRERPDTAVAA
jgi:hypothetical protein